MDMKIFPLLLFCMIRGSTAFLCGEVACDDSALEELALLDYKPNKAELLHLCPPTLEFFNCYFKSVKDCLGIEVKEIAESDKGISSAIAQSLFNARSLAIELCDERSTLHKDYLENFECFDRLVDKDSSVCTERGETYAEAFLREWHKLENGHVDWEEMDCLERVYQLACFADQIEESCGEVARKTFLAIFEKVKSAVFAECNVDNPLSLKRSFFEYLELDRKRSELYWSVFKTFRRR